MHFQPFLAESDLEILYRKGFYFRKLTGVLRGFCNRWAMLLRVHRFATIVIHREAAPIGPPIFEWVLTQLLRKKIIYDFDDAIWLPNTSAENKWVAWVKCHWKVARICAWAHKVTCGNHFLVDYAKQYNPKAYFVPTTLDLEHIPFELRATAATLPTIGWTGTHSTLKYLQPLVPLLQELEQVFPFRFVVIADKNPELPLRRYHYQKWSKATEWQDLARLDIGLMPLGNSEWEEGKCGFKALQYMAVGIPCLVSHTKANSAIVEDGVNGFVCTPEEWKEKLLLLLHNPSLYQRFSMLGRQKVAEHYSKSAWQNYYQALLSE